MSIATSLARFSNSDSSSTEWKRLPMRLWSKILTVRSNFNSGIERDHDLLAHDFSATFELDEISSKLALETKARNDGGNELPSSTEEVVSGTQKEIIIYFKSLQRRAQHQIANLADRLRVLRETLDLPEATARLHDIPSRCQNEVLRRTAEFQSQLGFLREKEQQYEKLRDESLTNEDHKSSPALPMLYLLFAILIGAATIATIDVFSPGMFNTLLVSASWAVTISLIYLLVPFVLAAAVSRAAGWGQIWRLLATWLGVGITVAFVGLLAFGAAYYVAILSGAPTPSAESIIDMIVSAPSAIGSDVAAWTAAGVVILTGILAFLAGHRTDHTNATERTMWRALLRAREKRELQTRRLRKRVNAIVDSAESDVTRLLKGLKESVRQYSQLVDDAKRIPQRLSEYDIALEDACNILLDRYRAANGNARKTDLPMSFSEHVCFRTEPDAALSLFDDEEGRLEGLRKGVADLEVTISTIRQQLRDLNWSAISELQLRPQHEVAQTEYSPDIKKIFRSTESIMA